MFELPNNCFKMKHCMFLWTKCLFELSNSVLELMNCRFAVKNCILEYEDSIFTCGADHFELRDWKFAMRNSRFKEYGCMFG